MRKEKQEKYSNGKIFLGQKIIISEVGKIKEINNHAWKQISRTFVFTV